MACLLIKDGLVVNSIVAPITEWEPPEGYILVDADGDIGDAWDGEKAISTSTKPVPVSLDDVSTECRFRIYAAASASTQSNMLFYLGLLNARSILGKPLASDASDLDLFNRCRGWIDAMRSTVPKLIGDVTYQDDSNWPPLGADLTVFAARF